MIASRAELDARLSDLWRRRDRLTDPEVTELWGLVHSILNSVSLSHFQTLTDSPTDYISDFFTEKVVRSAREEGFEARSVHAGALIGFFANYLVDRIRARNRRQQWLRYENELPDDEAGGDKPVNERDLPLKTEPLDPLTLLGVQADDVARSAMKFLQGSEDWVQIFLCCHHCRDAQSRIPLSRLAEIHAISSYDYWARKLGIAFKKHGYDNPEEFGATLLGQWVQGLGIALNQENAQAVAAALEILCATALEHQSKAPCSGSEP
jgi:hypothetical protein